MWVYFLFGWGKNLIKILYPYIYLLNSIEMLEINLDNLKLSLMELYSCNLYMVKISGTFYTLYFVVFRFLKGFFIHFLSIFTTPLL